MWNVCQKGWPVRALLFYVMNRQYDLNVTQSCQRSVPVYI